MNSRRTELALAHLAAALPQPGDLAAVGRALAVIGTALRVGLELPAPVRSWTRGLSSSDLEGALDHLAGATPLWNTATATLAPGERVERREEADGARRAAMRIGMSQGVNVASLASFGTLGEAIARFDRNQVEAVDDVDREPRDAGTVASVPEESLGDAIPDDDVVLRYIRHGTLAYYVETVAFKNPTFAEELAACIDAVREDGVSLYAGWWRARYMTEGAVDPRADRAGKVVAFPVWRRRLVALSVAAAAAAALVMMAGGSGKDSDAQAEVVAREQKELAQREAQLNQLQAEEPSSSVLNAVGAGGHSRLPRDSEAGVDGGRVDGGVAGRPTRVKSKCPCDAGECSCF